MWSPAAGGGRAAYCILRREVKNRWYSAQTEWTESHGYNDPQVPTERLRGWFQDIIETFPPMNGPLSNEDDIGNPKTTDYCVGRTVIYAAFAWSQAEAAYRCMRDLAEKHGVGFFDVSSSDGAVWLPASDGSYKVAFYATRRPGLLHNHPLQ